RAGGGGEDRGGRSRPAEGGRNSAPEVAINASRVGGGEITCDDDAGLDDGGGRRFAQELAHHLARQAGQVLCPRAEILVIAVAVLGRNSLGRRVPGLRGVLALLEDRAPGGLEQCVVVEEEQVGVEDGGAVLARPGGDGLAGCLDLGAPPLDPPLQCLPLRLRVTRRLARNLRRCQPKMSGGSERRAGGGGQPGPGSPPGRGGAGRGGAWGWRGGGPSAGAPSKSPSPSAATAATVSPASGPRAVTRISCP